MALILNLESATAWCSVAIGKDGILLETAAAANTFAHSEQITLLIQQVCQAAGVSLADLDAVAVSQGPGSYTSLRVGMSTAKGICYALNKPMIGVSTLLAQAQGALLDLPAERFENRPLIIPMIDARRMEVYTNIFDLELMAKGEDEAKIIEESSYQNFFQLRQNLIFTGDGCEKCRSILENDHTYFYPSHAKAAYLVPLAEKAFQAKQFLDIAYAAPFYLKAPNITTPKKLL
ncbi:MAG: tRNA (adenosine(37)-N6)-threonylcarbamoyltransferase complex dimerization subunit type 1 TsaB [Saprospiraceae bacterium]